MPQSTNFVEVNSQITKLSNKPKNLLNSFRRKEAVREVINYLHADNIPLQNNVNTKHIIDQTT